MTFGNFFKGIFLTIFLTWLLGASVLVIITGILMFLDYLLVSNYFDYVFGIFFDIPIFFRHIVVCLMSIIYIIFEYLFSKQSKFVNILSRTWKDIDLK